MLLDEFCEERKIKSLSASTIKISNPKAKISFYAKRDKLVIRKKEEIKKRELYSLFSR
ncbi:MAG: hypothetical protein ABIN23_02180 [candidate division WOR-3 bacterium]